MSPFLLFTLIFLISVNAEDYHGDAWQSQSASTKITKLNSAIQKNKNSAPWPGTWQSAELLAESMDKTFDSVGDDMPTQLFNLETRKKLIHSVGAVIDATYVSLNQTYSGIFRSGCKNVILRFSIAQKADTSGKGNAIAPGIALKFLRDGVPSGNVFAMYSLLGQTSFNFFKHDLSSHVPDLPGDAPSALQLVRWKFSTASGFPVFTGLSNIAAYEENGNNQSKIAFPFRLHFHPNTTLHNLLPDTWTGTEFEDQLIKILFPSGIHMYDVYAQDTPFSENLQLIGKVFSNGYATRSLFGDKTLFYEHTRFEDDLEFYPSWKDKAQEIMDSQRQQTGQGYIYPDLPFSEVPFN